MRIINPPTLSSPRGYNHGMLFSTGKYLFVAGQIGWDKNQQLVTGLTAQFDQALANILEVVQAAGGSKDSIGRFSIYIKDKKDYLVRQAEIGEVYRRKMGTHYPAMSLLIVNDLLEEGALVEIE